MKTKYDEFYFENDKNYDINVYWKLYDENHQNAIKKYEGHIFCPICRLAPLTVAKGNERRYFKVSAENMNKHDEYCPYRLEKASKKETKEFYDNIDDIDIENRLKSCMNRMLKSLNETKYIKAPKENCKINDRNDFFNITTSANKKKYIPHKSLYSKNLDNNEEIKIYYGECNIYIYKYVPLGESEAKIYYLKILSSKTNKQICDISISINVYKYLKDVISIMPCEKKDAQKFYLCFVGVLTKKDYSYNCVLKTSKFIMLERIMDY